MTKLTPLLVRFSTLLVMLALVAACTEAPAPIDPAYRAEVEQWRADRLEKLTAEDGWLSLTGLNWLTPGENRFGSAPDSAVVLPDSSIPEIAGLLILGPNNTVAAHAAPGSGVQINGEPLATASLRSDAEGEPDIITAGRISFYIIDRDGRMGARVKDPQSPARAEFAGIENFPVDEAYRVTARFESYQAPREVAIPTVLGQDTSMIATGLLRFTIDGCEQTLEPYVESPDDERLFLIFRDPTSGDSTYGAGRFLSADAPGEDATTVLDFNRAYNPPCAFTPYATCPLPPPQNMLEVPIEAGEMYRGAAH
ncbi:MAG: DUF1684 domain-containing protein [Thermoanaerobaculales bacterium]